MITVRVFGVFRLDSGVKRMEAEAASVKELLPLVLAEAKRIKPDTKVTMKDVTSCVVVVNGKRVDHSAPLCDGDEVMLVPAVAGG